MAPQTLTIGRRSDSDIRLDDRSVSRAHAELTLTSEGRYYLTDLDSLGGTWVFRDGRWASHRQGYVEPNELLRFGGYEVNLRSIVEANVFEHSVNQPRHESGSNKLQTGDELGTLRIRASFRTLALPSSRNAEPRRIKPGSRSRYRDESP